MRTTIDLPDDIHAIASAIARDSGTSLGVAIGMLVKAAVGTPGQVRVATSPRTGLRVISTGRVVTSEDVRTLDDE